MQTARAWRPALGRYLAVLAARSLAWEFAQMPFYTAWRTGSAWDIAFAALHCAGGDVLIGGASLAGGLLLFGGAGWPRTRFLPVAAAAMAFGLGLTLWIEHAATARGIWTYSDLMPVLPGLGTGLAPLAQWVVVPLLAFAAVRRRTRLVQASRGLDCPTMAFPAPGITPDHLNRSKRGAS